MEITNLPGWVVVFVGLANLMQIFSALALIVIAIVLVGLLGQIKEMLNDVSRMTDEVSRHIPSMMNSADSTLKNVKTISDDAASTTHNVTTAVDRVAHLVGAVSGRMESPAIKLVGALTGLAAGLRVFGGRGDKHKDEKEPPRR